MVKARATASAAERVRREYPLLFWSPQNTEVCDDKCAAERHARCVNWSQVEFFESLARLRCYKSGNRGGKTEAISVDAAIDATGIVPAWLVKNCRPRPYRAPPNRVWIASETYEQVREVERKLRRLLPPSMIAEWPKRDPVTIELTNGSAIALKTYGSGIEGFASADVDRIKLDEKCPEDVFAEALMRLVDRNGEMTMSLTPTRGLSWVYNRFYEPWLNADERPIEGLTVDWIIGSIHDNPYLSDEARAAILATLTEEERLVREHGEFIPVEGRPVIDRVRLAQVQRADVRKPAWRGEIDLLNGRPKIRELSTGRLAVWEWPRPGYGYASGWDVALGLRGTRADATAGHVLCRYDDRQVAEWHPGGDPERPGITATRAVALAMLFNNGYLGWEVNNHGHVFSERILHENLYHKILYRGDPDSASDGNHSKVGWRTDSKSRGFLIELLREGLEEEFRGADAGAPDSGIRSRALVAELMTFVRKESGKEEHADGAHDDRLFARGVALATDRKCPFEGWKRGRDEEKIRVSRLDPASREAYEEEQREVADGRREPQHPYLGEHW